MNRKMKYSILYNYKKSNHKIISVFAMLVGLCTIYLSNLFINANKDYIRTFTPWDLYCAIYINMDIIVSILIFLSLYFIFNCFENIENEFFAQIRVNNFFYWFTSKIISIFIFNFIITTSTTIFIFIIGVINLGLRFTWSISVYSNFYSPTKIAFLNILTYSFFITFLSLILGVLFVKINNKIIPTLLGIIYIVLDKVVSSFIVRYINIFKYFSLNNYINFRNRDFYHNASNYITVKSSVIFPIILMFFAYLIIKYMSKCKMFKCG